MRRSALTVALVLSLAGALALGYFVGSRTERVAWQASVADAQASKTLVVIRRDIQLLTAMREKKHPDLVKEAELWTVTQLSQIDPSKFISGSSADYLYPQTIELVNAYRKQFPDTMINPEKEPTIAKAFARVQ